MAREDYDEEQGKNKNGRRDRGSIQVPEKLQRKILKKVRSKKTGSKTDEKLMRVLKKTK